MEGSASKGVGGRSRFGTQRGFQLAPSRRTCSSGDVLRARSLLSGTVNDLAPLLNEMAEAISVVNDRQTSIRRAAARVLPRMPHQLCRFHVLREAPLSVFEAGRHANEELKKQARSVRPIGRAVEGRDDAQAGGGLGCSTAMPCPACRAPYNDLEQSCRPIGPISGPSLAEVRPLHSPSRARPGTLP